VTNPLSLPAIMRAVIADALSDDPEAQARAKHGMSLLRRMGEAEALQREKARDPVKFLLARFDFSGAPMRIGLKQKVFDREQCLLWWDQVDAAPEPTREPPPVYDAFDPNAPALLYTTRRPQAPPKRMRLNFTISPRAVCDETIVAERFVLHIVSRNTGFVPRVGGELELFRKLFPELSAEGL
jgi:hypothetical protein